VKKEFSKIEGEELNSADNESEFALSNGKRLGNIRMAHPSKVAWRRLHPEEKYPFEVERQFAPDDMREMLWRGETDGLRVSWDGKIYDSIEKFVQAVNMDVPTALTKVVNKIPICRKTPSFVKEK
jgi:hypothetical protein